MYSVYKKYPFLPLCIPFRACKHGSRILVFYPHVFHQYSRKQYHLRPPPSLLSSLNLSRGFLLHPEQFYSFPDVYCGGGRSKRRGRIAPKLFLTLRNKALPPPHAPQTVIVLYLHRGLRFHAEGFWGCTIILCIYYGV